MWDPHHVSRVTTPRSSNDWQCGTKVASGLRESLCTSFFTAQKNNYVTLASGSHTPQSSPPAICHPTPPPSSPPPISVDPLLIRGHPPPPANPTTAAPGPSLPRLLHRRLTRRSHHCRRRCLHLRPNRSLRSRRSSTCYCTVRDPSG